MAIPCLSLPDPCLKFKIKACMEIARSGGNITHCMVHPTLDTGTGFVLFNKSSPIVYRGGLMNDGARPGHNNAILLSTEKHYKEALCDALERGEPSHCQEESFI